MTLNNKYHQVMEHVVVDDEMKKRVIQNLQKQHKPSYSYAFKKWAPVLTMAALVLIVLIPGRMLFSNTNSYESASESTVALSEGASIESYTSIDELENQMGFTMITINELPFEVIDTQYMSYFGATAEVTYLGDEQTVTIRKEVNDIDISGDYRTYTQEKEIEINGVVVTICGNDDQFAKATWFIDEYSYAIILDQGVQEQELTDMIQQALES